MIFEKHKQRTFTNYWNHFGIVPKENISLSALLKKTKKFIKKFIKISIQFKLQNSIIDQSFGNRQIDADLNKITIKLLQNEIIIFLKNFNLKFNRKNIIKYIIQFNKIYFKSPVKDLGSGIAYNQGLIIFVLIKIIKPTDIIESGVMRGFSTYIIDKASTNNTKIHSYDINFDKLIYKSNKAIYCETDINNKPPIFRGKKILSLYDDHVSHLDRLKLSKDLKIKYNIFDDDLSFFNFHSDGWPPLPTINMLLNFKKFKLKNKKKIRWISHFRHGEMNLKNLQTKLPNTRKYKYCVFPDFFTITGYKNHGQTSFLILEK